VSSRARSDVSKLAVVESEVSVDKSVGGESDRGGWRGYLRSLGPGLVTGASDDDPSGIATYSQAGAQFKYSMLWSALLTLPLMAGVQEICDRTALATGKSMGELFRMRFAKFGRAVMTVLLIALLVANTANITADLLAIGEGMNLLHAGPVWVWALVAGAVISVVVVSGSFATIARIFKYLCLSLLTYVAVLFVARAEWKKVATNTLVPHIQFTPAYLGLLVGVLGTTLSPYLFFWQTAHRVEDMEEEPLGGPAAVPLRQRGPLQAKIKERRSRFDVFSGMTLSNGVMFAIIVATASTLGRNGITKIDSAAAAAKALEPIAGQLSTVLFALGFIGTGFLAVPVLAASASVGLAGLHDKKWGFSQPIHRAPLFYAMVAVGTIGGTLLALSGVNPIRLLIVVAIVNGVAAAPFLIAIMVVSSDRRIMGDYRNGKLATTIGWLTTLIMTAGAVVVFATGGF
jgi:NRAMP (natural resistance-associated macrophage protein)-like metal ion transporter